jgi:hypothetical protein
MDLSSGEAMGSVTMALPNELQSPVCNGYGGEFAYSYSVVGGPKALIISTDHPETTLDTVVYVRSECRRPDLELGCSDDEGTGRTSYLVLPDVQDGEYFIIVDSFGPGSLGDFKVTVEERTGLHGSCDAAMPDCAPGLICRPLIPGDPTTCEYHACADGIDNDGDGVVDFPVEPGCDTADDDVETDPVPAPACGNGLDDDLDGFTDYPDDPGCDYAADGIEIDECVPGAPVADHPGGPLSGSTVGGSNVLAGPCGSSTATSPEKIYYFDFANDLTSLTFSLEATTFDAVLYVRGPDDCTIAGPISSCNDPALGVTGSVTLADPVPGGYFGIVDGEFGASGNFTLRITGVIDLGGTCIAGDMSFVCEAGTTCGASATCEPAACNDGADNDGDGDVDYPNDAGCIGISDADETDPVPAPQCGDGIDNDTDGAIDYPADSSCSAAADDDESCMSFGTNTFGYQGCQDTLGAIPPCEDLATSPGALTGCTGDDCSTSVALAFPFSYYGVAQTSVSIISNGKLAFPGGTAYSNTCTIEANTIAVFWDDLYPPSGGAIRYQTFGTAPNRHMTVQWNIPHISETGLYDIRAVLYEGSNDIDMCYVDTMSTSTTTENGASATVGINGTSDQLQFSCNSAVVVPGLYLHYDAP